MRRFEPGGDAGVSGDNALPLTFDGKNAIVPSTLDGNAAYAKN